MILFIIFCSLVIIEIVFRMVYKTYIPIPKIKWKENYVEDHPFLSLSYGKNKLVKPKKLLSYELQKDKYYSYEEPLKLNNMGHFGNDFDIKTDASILRIACLGDSTTANNIAINGVDYSYPKFLQTYLSSRIHKRVDVYNFGIGGWTSVDILIDFLLNVINTKPDYVILSHAFVDLHLYLMDNFSLDYSHGRCNLGRGIFKLRMKSIIPQIKFWHSYEYIRTKLFGTGNIRDDVIMSIRTNTVNIKNKYKDLTVEKNILKNIFIICKHYGIKLIVGTYPFYNYNKTLHSNKIEEGVIMENNNIKELSEEFNTCLVDQDALILKNDDYFLDWMHLTPTGMKVVAENYGNEILKDYNTI